MSEEQLDPEREKIIADMWAATPEHDREFDEKHPNAPKPERPK